MFAFDDPVSVRHLEPAWKRENWPDLLLQVDLENVGDKRFLWLLPDLHAACAAAEIDLRVYATSLDRHASYATHRLDFAGKDSADLRIVWDAAQHMVTRDEPDIERFRPKKVLVVTRDHFGSTLASLGAAEYMGLPWLDRRRPDPSPNRVVSHVNATSELPPLIWSHLLGVKTLNGLLAKKRQKSGMRLQDAEGSIYVPATIMSCFVNETGFRVKSVMVMKNSDEVQRFQRFLWRYSAATGFGGSAKNRELSDETQNIFRCIYNQNGGPGLIGTTGILGCYSAVMTRPEDQTRREENMRLATSELQILDETARRRRRAPPA